MLTNNSYLSLERDPLPSTVGETPTTHNTNDLAQFVLPANKELDMVFQFEMMEIDGTREGSPRAVAPGTTQLLIAQDFEAKKIGCQNSNCSKSPFLIHKGLRIARIHLTFEALAHSGCTTGRPTRYRSFPVLEMMVL